LLLVTGHLIIYLANENIQISYWRPSCCGIIYVNWYSVIVWWWKGPGSRKGKAELGQLSAEMNVILTAH